MDRTPTIPVWTGRETKALRQARRMSIRDFAAHLGVSDRMVSKWEAAGAAIRPGPVNQQALDTSSQLAAALEKELFRTFLAGWTCPYCGTYVETGATHACKKGF